MIDLSIVIPVYNAEKYLNQCVNSIMDIEEFSYEVILVDDGSTDYSGELCDELALNENINVIHKKNEGVSTARNVGIREAKGKYIIFVDSDDFIDSKILSEIMDKITDEDIAISGFNYYFSESNIIPNALISEVHKTDLKNNISNFYDEWNSKYIFYAIYGKVYVNQIIKENNLLFEETYSILEDSIFVWRYLKYCNKIFTSKINYYSYRQTQEESLVKKYNQNAINALRSKYYNSIWVLQYLKFGNKADYYVDLFNKVVEYAINIYINEDYKTALKKIKSDINLSGIIEIRDRMTLSAVFPMKRRFLYWTIKKGYINFFLIVNIIWRGR